jgi:hypothetical protein
MLQRPLCWHLLLLQGRVVQQAGQQTLLPHLWLAKQQRLQRAAGARPPLLMPAQ